MSCKTIASERPSSVLRYTEEAQMSWGLRADGIQATLFRVCNNSLANVHHSTGRGPPSSHTDTRQTSSDHDTSYADEINYHLLHPFTYADDRSSSPSTSTSMSLDGVRRSGWGMRHISLLQLTDLPFSSRQIPPLQMTDMSCPPSQDRVSKIRNEPHQ